MPGQTSLPSEIRLGNPVDLWLPGQGLAQLIVVMNDLRRGPWSFPQAAGDRWAAHLRVVGGCCCLHSASLLPELSGLLALCFGNIASLLPNLNLFSGLVSREGLEPSTAD